MWKITRPLNTKKKKIQQNEEEEKQSGSLSFLVSASVQRFSGFCFLDSFEILPDWMSDKYVCWTVLATPGTGSAKFFKRPGVAKAVLQTALRLIN